MLDTQKGDPAWQASAGHLGERIHALIDGELAPRDEAEVQAHLADCADCRSQHAQLAAAVSTLAALGPGRAPMGFSARVLKRVRSARRGSRFRMEDKVPYEGGIIVLLAAACAAAVLAYAAASHSGGLFVKLDRGGPATVGRP